MFAHAQLHHFILEDAWIASQQIIFHSHLQISLLPPNHAHGFLCLTCKIVVYLLTRGRDHSHCLSALERLNNRRKRNDCSVLLVLLSLCWNTPIEMHEGSLGFGEDQQRSEIFGRPLVLGDKKKKSEAIPAFCHWRGRCPRRLSLNSCGLPPTVLWGCLFLNK